MTIATWLASFFPSRNQPPAGPADLFRMSQMERPGLNAIDMINFGFVQPVLRNAYTLAENCSLLSDIAQTLTQENFRSGVEHETKFMKKCNMCGYEMKEKKLKCDACGSEALRDPSYAQLMLLNRADGYTWLERVNDNNQTLIELMTQVDLHLNVSDNAYIIAINDYLFYNLDDDIPDGFEPGDVQDAFPREFLALDPRFVEKVFDAGGRPGGHERICLKHRDHLLDRSRTRCPECGLKTKEIVARYYSSTTSMQYFTADEIIHLTKYYPHPLYGTPPAFKLRMNVFAYLYIEARIKNYYEKGRPPGIISIATDNPASVEENIKKINAMFMKDANALPWMPVSTGQSRVGKAVEYVPFMQDPSPQMMEVKNEVRRGICSFFNVSPIFMSDTEGSGGLNNEGHQITILNRAIEKGQSIYNDKAFIWFFNKLHITDWRLLLNKSEQADEKDTAELQILKDQHAKNLIDMGFKIWIHEGQYKHEDFPTNPPTSLTKPFAGMNMPIPEKDMKHVSGQTNPEKNADG